MKVGICVPRDSVGSCFGHRFFSEQRASDSATECAFSATTQKVFCTSCARLDEGDIGSSHSLPSAQASSFMASFVITFYMGLDPHGPLQRTKRQGMALRVPRRTTSRQSQESERSLSALNSLERGDAMLHNSHLHDLRMLTCLRKLLELQFLITVTRSWGHPADSA